MPDKFQYFVFFFFFLGRAHVKEFFWVLFEIFALLKSLAVFIFSFSFLSLSIDRTVEHQFIRLPSPFFRDTWFWGRRASNSLCHIFHICAALQLNMILTELCGLPLLSLIYTNGITPKCSFRSMKAVWKTRIFRGIPRTRSRTSVAWHHFFHSWLHASANSPAALQSLWTARKIFPVIIVSDEWAHSSIYVGG